MGDGYGRRETGFFWWGLRASEGFKQVCRECEPCCQSENSTLKLARYQSASFSWLQMSKPTLSGFVTFCKLLFPQPPFTSLLSLNIHLLKCVLKFTLFTVSNTERIQNRKTCCKNCSMWVRPAWIHKPGQSQDSIRCVRRGSLSLTFFFQPSAILPARAETRSVVFDQQQGFNKTDCAVLSGFITRTFTTLHICKYQPRPNRFHSCWSTSQPTLPSFPKLSSAASACH